MAPGLRRKILLAAAVGVLAVLVLVVWRHFFWQHAVLVGVAVGALVFSVLRTTERLRKSFRR